jgi:hypothetical protein
MCSSKISTLFFLECGIDSSSSITHMLMDQGLGVIGVFATLICFLYRKNMPMEIASFKAMMSTHSHIHDSGQS